MKSLVLRLFSVIFILGSFSVYSRGLPDNLQEDAKYLMQVLSQGNVEAYREKKENIGYKDMKKIISLLMKMETISFIFWSDWSGLKI